MRSACGALVTRGGDGNSPKPPRQRTFSPSLSSCFCSAFLLLLLLDSGRLQASTTERVVSCPEKRAPMRRHTPQKARRQTSYGIRSIGRCTITCHCGVVPCRIAVDDGTLLLAAVPCPVHTPPFLPLGSWHAADGSSSVDTAARTFVPSLSLCLCPPRWFGQRTRVASLASDHFCPFRPVQRVWRGV